MVKSKKVLLILLVTLSLSNTYAKTNSFNLDDRIKTYNFLEKYRTIIFDHPFYSSSKVFNTNLEKLNRPKKNKIIHLIKELDPALPGKILRAYIYWSEIKYTPEKIKNIFEYYIFYKALTLRDYIDHPQNFHQKKKAQDYLKEVFNLKKITSFNFYNQIIPVVEKWAKDISHEKSLTMRTKKIINLSFLSPNILTQLKGLRPYIIDPLGYIPYNTSKNNISSLKIQKFITGAKRFIIADINFFKQKNALKMENFLNQIKKRQEDLMPPLKVIITKAHSENLQEVDNKLIKFLNSQINKYSYLKNHISILPRSMSRIPASNKTLETLHGFKKNLHKKLATNKGHLIIDEDHLFIPESNKSYRLIKGPIAGAFKFKLLKQLGVQNIEFVDHPKRYQKSGDIMRIVSNNTYDEVTLNYIDMIKNAKKSIILYRQSLTDKNIIHSLLIRKIQKPHLKINFLVREFDINDIRQIKTLRELNNKEIDVKITRRPASIKDFAISVDGQTLMEGLGSEQSYGIQSFNFLNISNFDQDFMKMFLSTQDAKKLSLDKRSKKEEGLKSYIKNTTLKIIISIKKLFML